jgi:hypothetical protein
MGLMMGFAPLYPSYGLDLRICAEARPACRAADGAGTRIPSVLARTAYLLPRGAAWTNLPATTAIPTRVEAHRDRVPCSHVIGANARRDQPRRRVEFDRPYGGLARPLVSGGDVKPGVRVGPSKLRHRALHGDGPRRIEHGEGMMRRCRRCARERCNSGENYDLRIHRHSRFGPSKFSVFWTKTFASNTAWAKVQPVTANAATPGGFVHPYGRPRVSLRSTRARADRIVLSVRPKTS